MSSQHSPASNHSTAERLGQVGPYPAGTLLGVDLSYALHSLVPWMRTSTPIVGNDTDLYPGPGSGPASGVGGSSATGGDAADLDVRRPASDAHTTLAKGSSGVKARRFKPTLNCNACVERKTRCDRRRPSCVACLRRLKPCVYNPIANAIATTGQGQHAPKHRRKNVALAKANPLVDTSVDPIPGGHDQPDAVLAEDSIGRGGADRTTPPSAAIVTPSPADDLGAEQPAHAPGRSIGQIPEPDDLLRFGPMPSPSANARPHTALPTLAGSAARNPFGGEWSHSVGLSEVLSAIPTSDQCEALVSAYFDFVHPVIPVLSQQDFLASHHHIWASPHGRQEIDDPASLALCLAIFACGAQHSASEHLLVDQCLSACHEALCLAMYLRWHSLRCCQTLLILCHCLMTDCRVTEAWTFAGVTQRQACSLGLNRQDLTHVGLTSSETRCRIRLWVAIVHQDNVLSSILRVPRSVVGGATDMVLRNTVSNNGGEAREDVTSPTDVVEQIQHERYMRAVWKLAAFAEENNLYSSHAHGLSFCASTSDRSRLIAQLEELFASLDPTFLSHDSSLLENGGNISQALQITEVLSVFHLQMTSICMESNEASGMDIDVDGAVGSAHDGLAAFFDLAKLVPSEASTWSTSFTMAYLQASMLAEAFRITSESRQDSQPRRRDLRFMLAQSDCDRYIDVLERAQGNEHFNAIRSQRVAQLKELRSAKSSSLQPGVSIWRLVGNI